MLARKTHIEQVNRLHDKIDEVNKAIDGCNKRGDLVDFELKLHRQYKTLIDAWHGLDQVIEFTLKNTIDSMESD